MEHAVDEIVVALTERPWRRHAELLDCALSGVGSLILRPTTEKTLAQIKISHVNAGWLVVWRWFRSRV